MAISDYKITAEDIAKYGCVSLPDTLTGDAQENKAKFDRLVRECVANAVNAVIDHMVLVENEAQDWASAETLRVQAEAARVAAENLRVQAENDRADAETARAAAEAARVLAENLRAEAETARANAENKRDTAEKSRASAETGRVNAESARVTAESQRANAESVRAQNEAARISAETGRADAEADRVSAEDTRIANENARKSAETDRASAETVRESGENARKSAEKARASAEQQRESAESTRQTAEQSRAGAETARANAEKARADAETARVSAEQARATAESKRAAAETARQNAETGRTDAETKRVSAESARATAEGKRADAETARATAETKRVSAETARATAESTRQTNETARVSAEKSRAAAETARQTAENARNVWEEYSAGKAYVPGNKVSFNGSSYVCTAATTGHAPTDTAYWLLIAQKGEDGKGAGDMLASVYDPKGKAQDVFAYTDQKIAAIPTPDVSGQIETHNTAKNAHSALFAAKQDKIKGTKGKYLGFTATDTVGEVDAPTSGGSRITLTFATDFVGQAWTLSGGGETYTGTVDSSCMAVVSVLGINTTYTLSAALSGTTYTAEVTTKDYYTALEVTLALFKSTITVTVDSGSTVTATLGSTVLTSTSTGTAVFTVNKAGTWAIKATKGDKTAEGTVSITASGQSKSLTLAYLHIYGVRWDGTSTTKLSRTDDAKNFTDPVPAVNNGSGSSLFDKLMPWAGMTRETDSAAGELVKIPKYWYKWTKSGNTITLQIANKAVEGFAVSPAHCDRGDGFGERDVVYVGRYHCASDYKSKTGVEPLTSITRSAARSGIHKLGGTIWQWDWAMSWTIKMLYLVEFADWNSQAKIGYGCGNSSSAENMGKTDHMTYHTGTCKESRTTYGVGVQYRHIEGLWDNVYDWVDGCYYNSTGLNIILNPSKFSDSSGGTSIGTPSGGYPSALGVKTALNGMWLIPTAANGSERTYVPDYWDFDSGYPCLYLGGGYFRSQDRGLICVGYTLASNSNGNIGSRLMKLP